MKHLLDVSDLFNLLMMFYLLVKMFHLSRFHVLVSRLYGRIARRLFPGPHASLAGNGGGKMKPPLSSPRHDSCAADALVRGVHARDNACLFIHIAKTLYCFAILLVVPSNAMWPIKINKGVFAKRFEKIKKKSVGTDQQQTAT